MDSTIGRREFLGASLALAATGLHAAEPSVKFPTSPRERLSVSTYPFRTFIKSPPQPGGKNGPPKNAPKADPSRPQMTLAEFAATIPEKFGVHGIEPWSRHFESIEPDYVRELAGSFKKAGLRVVNIPCDARATLCGGTPEDLAAGYDTYRKWMDTAVLLGSPSIRIHLPRGSSVDDIACATETLKQVAMDGAAKNIVINIENDNPGTEDPFRVAKVLQAVNSPWLRSLPDFCNSRQLGDEAYNLRALRTLFPLAYNISHAKDQELHNNETLNVDPAAIVKIARNAGYRGYFSMEQEGGGDPYGATVKLLATCQKALS